MQRLRRFLTDPDRPAWQDLALLALLAGCVYLQALGKMPLLDPDESRYAEIPREMLERGDFVTPLLNYVVYFEKPPLLYWLNAASFALFGQGAAAARLPAAMSGLVTVLFTYLAGRRLFGRSAGMLGALVLASSLGFAIQARINIIDMLVTCCLTVTLGAFLVASRPGEPHAGRWYHLAYLGAALAILAKGLIGLALPGLVLVGYLLASRRWRLLLEMRLLTGLLLLLAVAVPWHLLVGAANPEFYRFYFIHEHFERFLTKVHGRYQPFWYFVPVLAVTMLPWSCFLPAALRGTWRERLTPKGDSRLFLLLWALLIFAFFSKSSSKLPPYILPVIPPLALLTGDYFARLLADGLPRPQTGNWLTGVVLSLAGVAAGYLPWLPALQRKAAISPLAGLVLAGLLLAMGTAALLAASRRDPLPLLAGLPLGAALLLVAATHLLPAALWERRSMRDIGATIRQQATDDTVVASIGLVQGVPFYAGRRTVVIGSPGEIEFGSRQGDQRQWFLPLEGLPALWSGQRPVLLVTERSRLAELQRTLVPVPREVAGNAKHALIANR